MSREEFESALADGKQYVLLDDLVLDVKDFMHQHIGGKFVIRNTIGTDISKFFYGGYSLENNADKARGHVHSIYAKMIVNDIAIAILEKDTATTLVCEQLG